MNLIGASPLQSTALFCHLCQSFHHRYRQCTTSSSDGFNKRNSSWRATFQDTAIRHFYLLLPPSWMPQLRLQAACVLSMSMHRSLISNDSLHTVYGLLLHRTQIQTSVDWTDDGLEWKHVGKHFKNLSMYNIMKYPCILTVVLIFGINTTVICYVQGLIHG